MHLPILYSRISSLIRNYYLKSIIWNPLNQPISKKNNKMTFFKKLNLKKYWLKNVLFHTLNQWLKVSVQMNWKWYLCLSIYLIQGLSINWWILKIWPMFCIKINFQFLHLQRYEKSCKRIQQKKLMQEIIRILLLLVIRTMELKRKMSIIRKPQLRFRIVVLMIKFHLTIKTIKTIYFQSLRTRR